MLIRYGCGGRRCHHLPGRRLRTTAALLWEPFPALEPAVSTVEPSGAGAAVVRGWLSENTILEVSRREEHHRRTFQRSDLFFRKAPRKRPTLRPQVPEVPRTPTVRTRPFGGFSRLANVKFSGGTSGGSSS